jgi:hypothetical protein
MQTLVKYTAEFSRTEIIIVERRIEENLLAADV